MKFKHDRQRKAAFRNMMMPKAPKFKEINSKSGLDGLHRDLFGTDQNIRSATDMLKKQGIDDAFGHMRIKL